MLERELDHAVDLHQVKRVLEVRSHLAANELLECGWLLHEVYISQDWKSNFILLSLGDTKCPRCGGPADVELVDEGHGLRYICQRECG